MRSVSNLHPNRRNYYGATGLVGLELEHLTDSTRKKSRCANSGGGFCQTTNDLVLAADLVAANEYKGKTS